MKDRNPAAEKLELAIADHGTRCHLTKRSSRAETKMNDLKKMHFKIELPSDVADLVTKAAAANNMTAGDVISECVSQQFEQALRHRVLIQRQDDVDEAILELARLVGRLSAGPIEPQEGVCRYRASVAE
jgi:hypothetical protein